MTLSISIFVQAQGGQIERDDLFADPPGSELAGFESTRNELWGSEAVKTLATFLPTLAVGDLWVEHEDLTSFEAECKLLLENAERVAGAYGAEYVQTRLMNMLRAIAAARRCGGGVSIS